MRLRSLHDLDRTEGTVQLRKAADASSSSSLVLVPRPSASDPNEPAAVAGVEKARGLPVGVLVSRS